MNKDELLKKITEKKEFSELPEKDVEMVFDKFDKPRNADYQKLKLTRSFLRKIFSSFASRKLLSPKEKDVEWFLQKHKSTKERFEFYEQVYDKIFSHVKEKEVSVVDLGCGINGFSYDYFKKKVGYFGVEAVGQLVDATNDYFDQNKISGRIEHFSLFEGKRVLDLIKKLKKPRIVFLFKVIDSLEFVERDSSKKFLEKIVPESDLVALSFATRSLGDGKKFHAQRKWITNFIEQNFEVLDDFELGVERYIVFKKNQ